MDWYFSLADTTNLEAWRDLRAQHIAIYPKGLTVANASAQATAAQVLTLAAIEWVRRERPDHLLAFVDHLMTAIARGGKIGDPQALSDMAGAAGLDRLGADADAETVVFANLAQWRQLGSPDLPCLVRTDGHVLVGHNPAEHLARFAA